MENKKCLYCGNELYSKRTKYCSDRCSMNHYMERKNKAYKNKIYTIKCEMCNIDVVSSKSGRRFCDECKAKRNLDRTNFSNRNTQLHDCIKCGTKTRSSGQFCRDCKYKKPIKKIEELEKIRDYMIDINKNGMKNWVDAYQVCSYYITLTDNISKYKGMETVDQLAMMIIEMNEILHL